MHKKKNKDCFNAALVSKTSDCADAKSKGFNCPPKA